MGQKPVQGALSRVAASCRYADGGSVSKPSQQEMADAWNANRGDPAKIYELMQANKIGVNEAAKFLGVDNNTMAQYLNMGRSAGMKQTGVGDDLGFVEQFKYDEVHPEAQTKEEFMATVEPWMLDASGRFKGPREGVNYRWEGMNPDEVYLRNQPKQWDPSMERDGYSKPAPETYADHAESRRSTASRASWDPVNLKWEAGPDNGGGVLGGIARAIGNTATGIADNPALMAALTAGIGSAMAPAASAGSAGATAGGVGTGGSAGIGSGTVLGGGAASSSWAPVQAFMSGPYAQPVMNAGKTLLSGGSLKDAALSGAASYIGSEVGSEVKGMTDSPFAGTAANTLTQSAIKGNLSGKTLDALASQYAVGQLTDLTGLPPQAASMVINLAKGKKTNPIGALTMAANAVGSKPLTESSVGGG